MDVSPSETYALAGKLGTVSLDERGVTHPRSPRSSRSIRTPWEEIVHVAVSPRAVWIGARRSVYVLPRAIFEAEHAPERLVRSILEHLAERPGGEARLQHMALVEARGRAPSPTPATWGLVGACLAVFVLQLVLGDPLYDVGYYRGSLAEQGDWWRLVTANLLHGFPRVPIHLGLNLLGLIALGTLCERPLGTARTLVVMGVSGVAAMGASGLAGYPEVVGVSGVVFGLLGAVTWLELRHGAELPAWWRVPRRALYAMLGLSALLGILVPFIAGAAHLGGLLGGAAATAVVQRPLGPVARRGLRAAASAVVAITLLAVLSAAEELSQPGDYSERLARRIADLPDATPLELNNRAWIIATDPEASPGMLQAALRMAERAVDETGREDATVLDTLAEVQFVLGRGADAVATIGEAIQREPDERYYREQLRRFTGERDADDRPDPPGVPGMPGKPEEEGEGIQVRVPGVPVAGTPARSLRA